MSIVSCLRSLFLRWLHIIFRTAKRSSFAKLSEDKSAFSVRVLRQFFSGEAVLQDSLRAQP